MRSLTLMAVVAALTLIGLGKPADSPAVPTIDAGRVLAHTKVLSSNEFEGRAPGTHGEERTVAYIQEQFKAAGLVPGNPDGTWVQDVPMVGMTTEPGAVLAFARGDRRLDLTYKDDFVAWTKRVRKSVSLDASDVVFVGYGIQAPEYHWDDYKGLDVRGKTLIMLVGDPPVPDPANPGKLDPKMFQGKAMTYYGRWTYKYEIGAKLGAAAVIIVHETGPAGYPFSVVQGKVSEQFDLVQPDQGMSRVAVEGWITHDQARKLCALAGRDYEELKRQALRSDFRPVDLATTASVTLHNRIRTIHSRNVAGMVKGGDPALKNEVVIYSAHWDHFGIGPEIDGDTIYHGALDNATGIGGLIELGRAFAALPQPPHRSILFLAVTAEEQGLLGSEYYAGHPLYPLANTVAAINMDSLNVLGKTRDITVTTLGYSSVDTLARQVATEQGRVIVPDPMPEKGSFFRSDHFPFAKAGVPVLYPGSGVDFVGKPAGWGKKMREEYIAAHYHKPSDIVRPEWKLDGAVEDLRFMWLVGYRLAQSNTRPRWNPDSPYQRPRK